MPPLKRLEYIDIVQRYHINYALLNDYIKHLTPYNKIRRNTALLAAEIMNNIILQTLPKIYDHVNIKDDKQDV